LGKPFGVLVTDVRMPEMDGLELIERVMERLPAGSVPLQVIVLTGHGTIDTAIRALRLHAVDFLRKPVTGDGLISAVRVAMQRCLQALEHDEVHADIQRRYVDMQQAVARVNATFSRLLSGNDHFTSPPAVLEPAADSAPVALTSRSE